VPVPRARAPDGRACRHVALCQRTATESNGFRISRKPTHGNRSLATVPLVNNPSVANIGGVDYAGWHDRRQSNPFLPGAQ
jgi:hypothetical protein